MSNVLEFAPLVHKLTKRVRDKHWREEAQQEAWVGILKSMQSHGRVGKPTAIRIIINACHTVCRMHKRDGNLWDFSYNFLEHIFGVQGLCYPFEAEFNLRAEEFLKTLTPAKRKVIQEILRGKEPFFSQKELAKKLGVSAGIVNQSLKLFRNFLEER